MKLKSILPVIFIIILSAIAFTACDAEDEPFPVTSNLEQEEINSILSHAEFSDSINTDSTMFWQMMPDSVWSDSIMLASTIAEVLIENQEIDNGHYHCEFKYKKFSVEYVSNNSRLYPPKSLEDSKNFYISYNASGLGSISYEPQYSVLSTSGNSMTVRFGAEIIIDYAGVWTDTKHAKMVVAFDGTQYAKIIKYNDGTKSSDD